MGKDRPMSRRDVLCVSGIAGLALLARARPTGGPYRQRLLAALDPFARRHGKYTAYELPTDEFIGDLPRTEESVDLSEHGYESHALSAAKFHPVTGALDDSSWRRVDPDNPRWQWHVHVWHRDDRAELFSHYEYRPDLRVLWGESWSDFTQRLHDHYYPKWDTNHGAEEATYFLGKSCPRIRSLLGTSE